MPTNMMAQPSPSRVIYAPTPIVGLRLTVDRQTDVGEQVFDLVRASGWSLSELRNENSSLEDVFRHLTEAV